MLNDVVSKGMVGFLGTLTPVEVAVNQAFEKLVSLISSMLFPACLKYKSTYCLFASICV